MAGSKEHIQGEKPLSPRFFTRFLRGTFHHYSAEPPARFSLFLRWLFRFLFGRVILADADAARINQIAKRGTIIYVTRNSSRAEYALITYLFREKSLPAPWFSHYISLYLFAGTIATVRRVVSRFVSLIQRDGYQNPYTNGYVEQMLAEGKPTLLPARWFSGLPLRFGRKKSDPLADIVRLQTKIDRPIYLVPIEIAYGRRPDREVTGIADLLMGTKVHPGPIRQILMLLRNRTNTTLLVAEPISLEAAVQEAEIMAPPTPDRGEEIAYMVRTQLIDRLNRERRVVLGPVLKSRSERIEQVLHDRELTAFLQDLRKADDKDFVQLRRDARKMLEEIAADYNPTIVSAFSWVVEKRLSKLYAEIKLNEEMLEKVRHLAREMPVVYVPCHKSHLDYLLVSNTLYRHRMSLPYIVAGVNLNFWPLGKIFRGSGAFFMRRTFSGKRLYSKVFSKYIEYLVRDNIPIEFFIEGSRSRTGKIILPKLGFLSILLAAVRASDKTNLAIVPVSINYERIWEADFYLDEAKGKKSEGENVSTMLKHRDMVSKKQGRMYMDLAEPFTLSDVLTYTAGRIPARREQQAELAAKIAYRVAHNLNSHFWATGYAVLAAVLLAQAKKGLYFSEIQKSARLLVSYLRSVDVKLEGVSTKWVEETVEEMLKEKVISTEADDEEERDKFYFLDEDKRHSLTIYKNSIVHHYQFPALLSLAFLGAGEPATADSLFVRFSFLKDLMGSELIYSEDRIQSGKFDRHMFDDALEFFTGHGFIVRADDEKLALNREGKRAAWLFAASLRDFVESYYILASTLQKHVDKEFSDKDWIKRAMKQGRRLVSVGDVRLTEAVHKNIIETGLPHMKAMEICEINDEFDDKKRRTRKFRVKDIPALSDLIDNIIPYIRSG
jgi:glycerol-3-phosphate O-acyltransferase